MIGSKMLAPGAKCILMQADIACEIGRSAALLLQQIHYWISNEHISGILHDNRKWIANTYEQWSQDIKVLSKSSIQRAEKKLKELGFIDIDQLLKHKGNRTNCISINYDKIESILAKTMPSDNSDQGNISGSPHQFKMTRSSIQNDSFIYSNKITNKDIVITKSEEQCSKSVVSDQSKQVQQVDEKNKCSKLNSENISDSASKSENQPKVVQEMVNIWNSTFSKSQTKLTKELARNLNYAFQHRFNSDMNLWKQYCLTIESSGYLTSDKFSLHLDWAIKFKTMDDIENGRYGVKNVIKQTKAEQEIEALRQDIIEEIETLQESEDCRNLRKKLLRNSVFDYSRCLRNVKIYQDGRFFFFIAETKEQECDIKRTYPIDFSGVGCSQIYEQIQNNLNQPVSPVVTSDLDFELMIINSSNESELIKAKRRELCEQLGSETYKQDFRNLTLIEREGDIWITDRSGKSISLSEKIREFVQDSIDENVFSQSDDEGDVSGMTAAINQLNEPRKCLDTRKAFLKTFGKETYSRIFHNLNYRENGDNVDFGSEDLNILNEAGSLVGALVEEKGRGKIVLK